MSDFETVPVGTLAKLNHRERANRELREENAALAAHVEWL